MQISACSGFCVSHNRMPPHSPGHAHRNEGMGLGNRGNPVRQGRFGKPQDASPPCTWCVCHLTWQPNKSLELSSSNLKPLHAELRESLCQGVSGLNFTGFWSPPWCAQFLVIYDRVHLKIGNNLNLMKRNQLLFFLIVTWNLITCYSSL